MATGFLRWGGGGEGFSLSLCFFGDFGGGSSGGGGCGGGGALGELEGPAGAVEGGLGGLGAVVVAGGADLDEAKTKRQGRREKGRARIVVAAAATTFARAGAPTRARNII